MVSFVHVSSSRSSLPSIMESDFNQITKFDNRNENYSSLHNIMKPLLYFGQFWGVFPVKSDQNKLLHSWLTLPPWINIFWTIFHIVIQTIYYPKFASKLIVQLRGTTLYTYVVSVFFQSLTTNAVFMLANYNGSRIVEAWSGLQSIMDALAGTGTKINRAKLISNLTIGFLALDFLSVWLLPFFTLQDNNLGRELSVIVLPASMFFLQFIPDLLTCIYCVFIWTAGNYFNAINVNLVNILKASENKKIQESLLSNEMFKIRILHARLCHVVGQIQSAFDFQLLALFIGATTSSIGGCYAVLMAWEGMIPGNLSRHAAIRPFFTTVICSLRFLVIILLCQRLMNASDRSATILSDFEGDQHNKGLNEEVEKFQTKVGNSPLRLKCCNIFNMGTWFLASCSLNATTYLLILIQFNQEELNQR